MPAPSGPIRLAIINDYEIVVRGLAAMLEPYADRIQVVELDSRLPVRAEVDIALLDTYPMASCSSEQIDRAVGSPGARRTVLYTWAMTPDIIAHARDHGIDAAISKGVPVEELVRILERVHAGELTLRPFDEEQHRSGVWPGQEAGLTARESEIVALITDGLSNDDIAAKTYLSINSVKSYIRTAYRKMGVSSRSQAVLWGIDHGFTPDRARVTMARRPD